EDEVLRLVNDTPYGLSGSIWTRDIGRALRVARGVKTGVLSINSSRSVHRKRPSAATSAAASAANWVCMRSSSTPKSRTSSSVSSKQEGFDMARTGTSSRERSTSTRADRTNGQSRRQEKTAKLTLEELVRQTKAGDVDTVIIAIADLQGRL